MGIRAAALRLLLLGALAACSVNEVAAQPDGGKDSGVVADATTDKDTPPDASNDAGCVPCVVGSTSLGCCVQ